MDKAKDSLSSSIEGLVKSLRGQITQTFGQRSRYERYSQGINRGVDVAIPKGTPIEVPPGKWLVKEAFSGATAEGPGNRQQSINQGYGNSVLLENQDTGETIRFSHLSGVDVVNGQTITGGVVGMSGATGNVAGRTGAHVDIEYTDAQGRLGDVTQTPYWKGGEVSYAQPTPQAVMNRKQQVSSMILKPGIVSPVMASEPTASRASQPSNVSYGSTSGSSPVITSTRTAPPSTSYSQVQPIRSSQPMAGGTQIIRAGDTLSELAKSYNTSLQTLLRLNPQISDPNKIYRGDVLYTPTKSSPVRSSSPKRRI